MGAVCSTSAPKISSSADIQSVEEQKAAIASPRKSLSSGSEKVTPKRGMSFSRTTGGANFTKIINEKCPLVRLDHCAETKKMPILGQNLSYTLEYCYVSQRGYYPTSLNKANQDSYLICENVLGDPMTNLFGVFDGHGEVGDFCSFFAADKFPDSLVEEIKKNGGLPACEGEKFSDIYTRAFLTTNFELHSSNVDDSLSGTTGITIFQRGDKLYVANVGDSRAIIATEVGGEIKSSPLSSDQTPYRKDERERLKKLVYINLVPLLFE